MHKSKKGRKPTVSLQYTVLHLTTGLCDVGVRFGKAL